MQRSVGQLFSTGATLVGLAVAALAVALLAGKQDHGQSKHGPSDGVNVVDVFGGPRVPNPPHQQSVRAILPVAARPMSKVLTEAPAALRNLHDVVAAGATDAASKVDQSALLRVFSEPTLRMSELTVLCDAHRCEVHGVAAGDETVTRLAIRDGIFLDRLAALGYSSGMDMVSARGTDSEIVVYLDRIR